MIIRWLSIVCHGYSPVAVIAYGCHNNHHTLLIVLLPVIFACHFCFSALAVNIYLAQNLLSLLQITVIICTLVTSCSVDEDLKCFLKINEKRK